MTREEARKGGRYIGSTRGVLGVAWLALLLAAGACQDAATAAGTAFYVTAGFAPELELTQLRVSVEVEGTPVVGPSVLPEQPARVLASGETLRVLLPPDLKEGTQVLLVLEGLRGGAAVARGEAVAGVREGYEVDVEVRLESWSAPPDGGTFCMGCPDGCCLDGACMQRTVLTCGVGGVACVACDGVRADTCSAQGVCTCGTGPVCTGSGVDRCVGGQCLCGDGPACDGGQACVDGQCRCTPGSCPDGCCDGSVCRPGTQKAACGRGGAACESCRKECKEDRTCR